MQKTIDIGGIQNAEKYVNQLFGEMESRKLENVEIDKNAITFSFSDEKKPYIRRPGFARQFSKAKYDSELVRQLVETFERKYNWTLKTVIEQKRYWVVIFSK